MRIARSFLAITLTATAIWTGCGGSSTGSHGGAAASAGTDANGTAGSGDAGHGNATGNGTSGRNGAGNGPGTGSCLAVGEAC